jgi:hypothetical protein
MSAYVAQLRQELTERATQYARDYGHALRRSHGEWGNAVFAPSACGDLHGNFHPASYRAILKHPLWLRRLEKVLTVPGRMREADDTRRLRELDSCCSSDALLMNVFCHPRVASSPEVGGLLGFGDSAVPIFGWRAYVPRYDAALDRTEVDMKLSTVLVEAKLTEAAFESCAIATVREYLHFEEVFRPGELPRDGRSRYGGYQLLRNVLAAHAHGLSFCLVCDARRPDLIEAWYAVLAAIRHSELRTRCGLVTWQELTLQVPASLREFLQVKYGLGQ